MAITSVEKAVTATYASLAIGEIVSFTFLFIFYKLVSSKRKGKNCREESSPQILFNIWAIALPLSINGFLTTAIAGFSKLMIPARLTAAGFTHSEALALIGKFSEMAMTIVFFPMIVIMSVSIILIPDLSKSAAEKNYYKMEHRVKEVLTLAFLLGVCILLISITMPDSLTYLLFKRTDLSKYLILAAIGAPLMYVSMTTYGILNGFGKQKIVLKNSIITALLQLLLCFSLIGINWINIYGYGIAMVISSIVGLILNMKEIQKHIYIGIDIGNLLIYLSVAILTFYLIRVMLHLIPDAIGAFKISFICLAGIFIFFFGCYKLKKKD